MKMRRDCEGHLIEMDLNKHAHSIQPYRKHGRICAYRQHGSAGAFVLELGRVRLNKANTAHMIMPTTVIYLFIFTVDGVRLSPLPHTD